MRIIKNSQIVEDDWTLLGEPLDGDLPKGRVAVLASDWLERGEALSARDDVGIVVPPDFAVEDLAGDEHLASRLCKVPLIAIQFPTFADGRGYSSARILRDRLGYSGEIRAVGHVLRDQLFYMTRVGFNSFQIAPGKDIEDALEGLKDFSVSYQPCSDDDRPIWSHRL